MAINQQKLFPLGDNPTWNEAKVLGFEKPPGPMVLPSVGQLCHPNRDGYFIQSVYARERRVPKRGEWYLSGSTVCAYRAPNDLSTVYHMAKLVKVRRETVIIVCE